MTHHNALARISVNTLCMYVAWAVRKLCIFALAVAVARRAGPADFGVYCLALVWMEAAIRLAVFGTDILIVRDTSARRTDAAELAGNALTWRMAAAAALYPLLILAARYLNHSAPLRPVIAIMGIGMCAQAVCNFYLSLVQGRERIDLHAAVQIAASGAGLLLGVLALRHGYGLIGLAWAYSIRALFGLTLATLLARRLHVGAAPRWDPAFIRRMLHAAMPIGVNRLLTVLYLGSGMTVLQLVHGEHALGLFAAAMKLFEACSAFGTLTVVAAFPTIARLHATARHKLRRTVAALVRLLCWAGIPMSLLVAMQARTLLGFFGPEFQAGAPALVLLTIAIPFSLNSELAERLAYVNEDQKKVLSIRFAGVALNLLLLLATVRWLSHLAPAIAILMAEGTMLALFLPLWMRYLPRCATPCLPGDPIAWQLAPPGPSPRRTLRSLAQRVAWRYLLAEQWVMEQIRYCLRYLLALLSMATGLCRLARRVGLRNKIVILAYHRIAEGDDPLGLNVSPRRFRSQMRYLARTMTPIDLDRVADVLAGTAPPPNAGVVVTFDDGYQDDTHGLRDAVRDHTIPTTIFVAPALLETAQPVWWEQLATLMHRAAEAGFLLTAGPHGPRADLRRRCVRRRCTRALAEALRPLPPAARQAVLENLARSLGAPVGATPASPFFTWDELRRLPSTAPIAIGSHAYSHIPLRAGDDGRLRAELDRSKAVLRERLAVDIRHMAYPSGSAMEVTPARERILTEAGFRTAATNRAGLVDRTSHPFELRRIGIADEPLPLFAAKVSGVFEGLKRCLRA